MARTVTHHFAQEHFNALAEQTSYEDVYRALSYLTMWAHDSYPEVRIYVDEKQREMLATYHKEPSDLAYCIAGVWNDADKKFGFHS